MAGGGAAGLTLADRLLDGPLAGGRVAVVDLQPKTENDRTFAHWTDRPLPYDGLVCRSWRQLRLFGPAGELCVDLGIFRYQVIRADALYAAIHDRLRQRPGAALIQGAVQDVVDGPEAASVCIDGASHQARWVFDSRFVLARDAPVTRRYRRITQRFAGVEIETDRDAFDPERPIFMDFRAPQAPGDLRFFYVLPYTARRALVELVSLRDLDERVVIEGYLRHTLGVTSWRELGRESGVSPLCDRPFRRRLGARVLATGIRGGLLKPSTGYAFTRILADAEAVARSLSRRGHPFDVSAVTARYRLYDAVLLHLLARHPADMPGLFLRLFEANPAPRLLRFLDDASSWREDLAIMASLPPAPFLRAGLGVLALRLGLAPDA